MIDFYFLPEKSASMLTVSRVVLIVASCRAKGVKQYQSTRENAHSERQNGSSHLFCVQRVEMSLVQSSL